MADIPAPANASIADNLPAEIVTVLKQAHIVRDLMDHTRAAQALGFPKFLYDALVADGSRVQRRAVSLAAERLSLGVGYIPPSRLNLPFPRSREQVMTAASALGLIASIHSRGGLLTRNEFLKLEEIFGKEMTYFASKQRRHAGNLKDTPSKWPITHKDALTYGCRLMASWAEDAAPALASFLMIAMPPDIESGVVSLPANVASLDHLMKIVLENYWGEQPPATVGEAKKSA